MYSSSLVWELASSRFLAPSANLSQLKSYPSQVKSSRCIFEHQLGSTRLDPIIAKPREAEPSQAKPRRGPTELDHVVESTFMPSSESESGLFISLNTS